MTLEFNYNFENTIYAPCILMHMVQFMRRVFSCILVQLMLYAFWGVWANQTTWSFTHLILIAAFIGSVGYSNVQRTDLLKQLFELKYGK